MQATDGFRDGRIAAFNPGFAWRPDARTRIALSYEYLSGNQSPESGLPFVDGSLAHPPRSTSYQSPSDVSERDMHRFRLDAQMRLKLVHIQEGVATSVHVYFDHLEFMTQLGLMPR